MNVVEKQSIIWIALLALPMLLPVSARGDQNVLSGGVVLGQDYDSNIHRDSSGEQSEWTSTVTPSLVYTHSEQTNTFLIKYAPSIAYHNRTGNEHINQFISGQDDISLTQKLSVHFQDTFISAEDPYSESDASMNTDQGTDNNSTIQLSDKRGRKSYWTNNFATRAKFEYGQESFVKLGYQYHVFDNKEAGSSDFVKQTPDISILHSIDHQWDTEVDYRFVKGDFDNSPDLITNATDLYLYYKLTPLTKVFGRYGYSQTDYDGSLNDYNFHTATLGTKHQFSPTLSLDFEGGNSFLQRDSSSDTDALYLRIALKKAWERSSWSLSADSGLDEQHFSGINDQGLSRYWDVKSAFSYLLMKDVTGTISLAYRDDTYLERLPEEKEQRLQGAVLLAYSFARWYQVAIKYTYINQNADIAIDQYDEHRVLFQLSATKDLFKW